MCLLNPSKFPCLLPFFPTGFLFFQGKIELSCALFYNMLTFFDLLLLRPGSFQGAALQIRGQFGPPIRDSKPQTIIFGETIRT